MGRSGMERVEGASLLILPLALPHRSTPSHLDTNKRPPIPRLTLVCGIDALAELAAQVGVWPPPAGSAALRRAGVPAAIGSWVKQRHDPRRQRVAHHPKVGQRLRQQRLVAKALLTPHQGRVVEPCVAAVFQCPRLPKPPRDVRHNDSRSAAGEEVALQWAPLSRKAVGFAERVLPNPPAW